MNLGAQTVVLVTVTENPAVRDVHNNPAKVRTETAIGGVRFRMVSTSETTAPIGNRVTEVWKLTAPPHPALLSATSRDEIRHDGTTYTITGSPKVLRDMSGAPHHVSVACARHVG